MTILEQFVAFAEGLSPEQRSEIEDFLASIMDADSSEFALTADELAEIDRRVASPRSEWVDEATFRAKLRKFQH